MLALVRRRCVLIVVLASACTRGNPAFGDGTAMGSSDGSATAPSTSEPNDTSHTGDPSMTGSVDSSVTSPSSDASDDAHDPTTTDDPTVTSDPLDPDLGANECFVPKPPIFDVVVFDAKSNPIEMPCESVSQIGGPVVAASGNQLVIRICENDTCDCEEGDEHTIEFIDLDPMPVDAINDAENGCVTVSVARGPDNDCRVQWMVMESRVVAADYPAFMATNSATPQWGLVVPAPMLGPEVELCAEGVCAAAEPGFYSMMLGPLGPLEPGGAPGSMMLDPYASGVTLTYDVHPQFAQVGENCEPAIGWAAIQAD